MEYLQKGKRKEEIFMINVKDMFLSKKLLGGFGLVIILLAVVGFIGYSGINTVGGHLNEIKKPLKSMKKTGRK